MTKRKLIAGAVLLGTAVAGGVLLREGLSQRPTGVRSGPPRPIEVLVFAGRTAGADDDTEEVATRSEPVLALATDPASERKLKAAADYLKQESWDEAVGLLQGLLDGPDLFVPVRGADGKEVLRWTTLHAETGRLFGEMTAPGRAYYQLVQGGRAKALLTQAKDRADPHLLAEAARRYAHTAAGTEATRLLAVHHLDRGRHALASLYFERLLNLPDAGKLSPAVLLTAAVAFQRAGDQARADRTWKQFTARAPDGLRLDEKPVSLSELQAWLAKDRLRPREPDAAAEWPLFRGDAARAARVADGRPVAEVRWRHDTAHEAATRTWLREAVRRQEGNGEAVLPAFFPVAVHDKVVYRSHRGIRAVDVRTGQRLWESEWQGGLDTLGQELRCFPYVESWVNAHLQHYPEVLFGNSVVGTLSTDGERVYAVEDLAIPAYQNTYLQRGRPVAALEYAFAPDLTEAVRHSRLIALDLKSGKLAWERGASGARRKPDGLYPSYFLGPPLPVGGRLYGLLEKDQELRLACFDAANGELAWALPLGLAPARLLADPARRLQAAPLTYAEGILLCPTHTGFLVAVDPISRTFLWAYPYREAVPVPDGDFPPWGRFGRGRGMPAPTAPPVLHPIWAAAAPVVAEGKVVFTAPDGPSVHCLSLRDGTLQWKVKRGDGDLYLAGVSRGKVLLVGKQACRALDLADGKRVWEVTTGLPAGLGAVGAALFFLPLRATAEDKEPAVYGIDLDSGRISVREVPPRKEAPGNLLFYQDMVLSQTATTITASPWRPSP